MSDLGVALRGAKDRDELRAIVEAAPRRAHLRWVVTKYPFQPNRDLRLRLGNWIEKHVPFHCLLGIHNSYPAFRTTGGGPWIWFCRDCKKEYA